MNIYFVVAYYLRDNDHWVVRLRNRGSGDLTYCTPNYTGNLSELKGLVFLHQPEMGYVFRVLPEKAMESVDSFMNVLCSLSHDESYLFYSCPILLYAGTNKEKAEAITLSAGKTVHLGEWDQAGWILKNPTVIDL